MLARGDFARAGGPEQQDIFALRDEARRGELEDERAIHFRVESEIESVEGSIGIAKARELPAALEQPVLAPLQFVINERGDEIDGRQRLALCLMQPRFEDRRHAREPQFTQRVIEFSQIHVGAPVVRSMRSR